MSDGFVRGLRILDGGALTELLASTHVEQERLCAASGDARAEVVLPARHKPEVVRAPSGSPVSGCPLCVGTQKEALTAQRSHARIVTKI